MQIFSSNIRNNNAFDWWILELNSVILFVFFLYEKLWTCANMVYFVFRFEANHFFFSLESTSFDQCKCQFTHEHLFLKPKSAVRVPGYPSRQGTFQSKFPLICLAEISWHFQSYDSTSICSIFFFFLIFRPKSLELSRINYLPTVIKVIIMHHTGKVTRGISYT